MSSEPSLAKNKLRTGTRPHAAEIVRRLHGEYPRAECELNWRTPLELLIATILSAQCTDVRVNIVTQTLFKKYRTPQDYLKVPETELQDDIRTTGFFRNKAKSIRGACQLLLDEFDGKVPQTMEEILRLPGVARKTGNVVLGTAFGITSGVVVDTHISRLSFRLGLTRESDPVKIERDLMKVLSREEWIFTGHALVWHGRRVCYARKPNCGGCVLFDICPKRGVSKRSSP
jgi:endonuclease-3